MQEVETIRENALPKNIHSAYAVKSELHQLISSAYRATAIFGELSGNKADRVQAFIDRVLVDFLAFRKALLKAMIDEKHDSVQRLLIEDDTPYFNCEPLPVITRKELGDNDPR